MIPKANRFHGFNSLRYVYQNGRMQRGPLFAIKAALNPKRQTYRVAVVVSRKVNKSAVTRNKIRRRLYESVRQLEGIDQPYDIVLTVFSDSLLEQSPQKIQEQLKRQLASVGVLSQPEKTPH